MSFEIVNDWTVALKAKNGMTAVEFDAKIHVDVCGDGDAPYVKSILAIYIVDKDRAVNLLDSDSGLVTLGELVKQALLDDDEFTAHAIEDAGFVFVGEGANDPDGRYEHAE